MTAQTLTLTDFILQRIAEDEAVAKLAAEDDYMVDGGLRWDEVGYETSPDLTIDPARVLAECEAKRRIVEESAPWGCQKTMCKILALPYADHPEFQEGWRA